MAQSTDEEIFKSLNSENSEEVGAGEIPPDATECSTLEDISESADLKTSELINNLKTSESIKEKVSPSKWVNFTRVLRLGLAANTNSDIIEMPTAYTEQITTHSKRGSLGKLFRHGFRQKAPIIEDNYEDNAVALQEDSQQQNKEGSLGKMFRHLKLRNSEYNTTNEAEKDEVSEDNGETRKHRFRKILRQKLSIEKRRPGTEEILPNTEPIYSGENTVTNPEQKMRSLGKMFRLKQNTYVSKEIAQPTSPTSTSSDKLTGT